MTSEMISFLPYANMSSVNNSNRHVFTNVTFTRNQANLLDGPLLFLLVLIFYIILQIPVVVFGMVTNSLNLVIFTLSGQRDSISIGLMALSISDLGYVTSILIIRILDILFRVFQVQSRISLARLGLANYISCYAHIFQDCSAVITLFVAVQKCCCVAIPYMFKDVFTVRKTTAALICLCLFITSTSVPLLTGMVFVSRKDSRNRTIISYIETDRFEAVLGPWLTFNRAIFPAFSLVIIVICIFVMFLHLKRSAKFRSGDSEKNSSKLGQKERRAITAVVMVSIVFALSTLLPFILCLAELLAVSFFADPRNHSFFRFLYNIMYILVNIGASINIFLYLKYNTKFKQAATALLGNCFGINC